MSQGLNDILRDLVAFSNKRKDISEIFEVNEYICAWYFSIVAILREFYENKSFITVLNYIYIFTK